MTTLFTAKAISKGGRNGQTQTADGKLSFTMSPAGGTAKDAKPSTNPEELFACVYATCFGSALAKVAELKKVPVTDATVAAEVSLNKDDNGFFLSATLNVSIPSLDSSQAEMLVKEAHKVCPYSKATRGNIEVTLKVNDQQLSKAA